MQRRKLQWETPGKSVQVGACIVGVIVCVFSSKSCNGLFFSVVRWTTRTVSARARTGGELRMEGSTGDRPFCTSHTQYNVFTQLAWTPHARTPESECHSLSNGGRCVCMD